MSTLIHKRVAECQSGENPKVVCRVRSGWVVLGDVQFLLGYSLLLPDPVVKDLNSLTGVSRLSYLEDMSAVGDALLTITEAERINYEILGNSEPALHAHVFPRYKNEPDEFRAMPAWFYDWEAAPRFDSARHSHIRNDLRMELERYGVARPREQPHDASRVAD